MSTTLDVMDYRLGLQVHVQKTAGLLFPSTGLALQLTNILT